MTLPLYSFFAPMKDMPGGMLKFSVPIRSIVVLAFVTSSISDRLVRALSLAFGSFCIIICLADWYPFATIAL